MKSYLLAFGKALDYPKLSTLYIVESWVKSLIKKPKVQENYAFPAGIQELNYTIAEFFVNQLQNDRIFYL